MDRAVWSCQNRGFHEEFFVQCDDSGPVAQGRMESVGPSRFLALEYLSYFPEHRDLPDHGNYASSCFSELSLVFVYGAGHLLANSLTAGVLWLFSKAIPFDFFTATLSTEDVGASLGIWAWRAHGVMF